VKKLEDSGYITRIVDPDNRRAVRLFLTEKGEKITPFIIRIDQEWEDIVTISLNRKDKTQLYVLLRNVAVEGLTRIRDSGESEYLPGCGPGGDHS
jgi:DNA-binding MarR family transcriptional regulator